MAKNFLGFLIIGLLFQFVKYIYPFLMIQLVWFGIAITVFVICTGGLVYSMLNNMPLFRFERNEFGQVIVKEYIMRGQRGQYAGEGYICSILISIIGLLYTYLANITKMVSEKSAQRIQICLSLFTLFVLQKILLMIYKLKSPWYNPGFMPPDYYQTGSLAMDQGNNI
jgi:hypothetical protein